MGSEPGLEPGAEPGWRRGPTRPPAPLVTRYPGSCPTATAAGGRGGGEGCGSLLGPPRARGTGCGRAVSGRKSGVSVALFLRGLHRPASLPESHPRLPPKAEASSGSAVKLLSEPQRRERRAAVYRGGREGALDGEAKTSPPDTGLVSVRFVVDTVTQRRQAIQWLRASDKMNKCIAL